jgi:hypothetical protein
VLTAPKQVVCCIHHNSPVALNDSHYCNIVPQVSIRESHWLIVTDSFAQIAVTSSRSLICFFNKVSLNWQQNLRCVILCITWKDSHVSGVSKPAIGSPQQPTSIGIHSRWSLVSYSILSTEWLMNTAGVSHITSSLRGCLRKTLTTCADSCSTILYWRVSMRVYSWSLLLAFFNMQI